MDSSSNGPGYGPSHTTLIVEARGLTAHDTQRTVHAQNVHKPIGIGRQRDQIMRAVAQTFPDAQLATMEDGIATFFSRTQIVVAAYSDGSRLRVEQEFETAGAFAHMAI